VNRPPPFSSTVQWAKRMRFSASTALVDELVYDDDILSLFQVATSATAAKSLIGSAKISSIEMWGPPAAVASTSTVSVEWFPGVTGIGNPSKIVSDTSMGSTFCSHVKASPPKTALAGMWLAGNGNQLISLNGPIGTVVDIVITFVLADGPAQLDTTFTITGATAGDVFVAPLDNTANKYLVPVSYATK